MEKGIFQIAAQIVELNQKAYEIYLPFELKECVIFLQQRFIC